MRQRQWKTKSALGSSTNTTTNGAGTTATGSGKGWVNMGIDVAEMWPKRGSDGFCICMVKKIKIKIKTTIEKVSKCHFGLLVLVYNNNDCQIVEIKSVMWQIIMSL